MNRVHTESVGAARGSLPLTMRAVGLVGWVSHPNLTRGAGDEMTVSAPITVQLKSS